VNDYLMYNDNISTRYDPQEPAIRFRKDTSCHRIH
jgi:hypothetical protein